MLNRALFRNCNSFQFGQSVYGKEIDSPRESNSLNSQETEKVEVDSFTERREKKD